MSANGQTETDIEVDPAIFQDLSNLEKEFATVELDALRKKEFNLTPLYARRAAIVSKLPSFWPQVLLNGPQEFQSVLSHEVDDLTEDDGKSSEIAGGNLDIATISAIKNLTVERYQIKSETEGEPRSLRFTFEFSKNSVFEDEKIVKDFEYVSHPDGERGGLVSVPVTFKWTKKGKKLVQEKTGGVLDLAVELYQAEEAAKFNVKSKDGKKGAEVDMIEREGLWQYEKLREKLEKLEDLDMEGEGAEGSWLDWFGYRGAVDLGKEQANSASKPKPKRQPKVPQGDGVEDEDEFEGFEDEDDEDDPFSGLLDVEIFPAGDDIAIALADDLWPNVIDYFMKAQDPLDDEDDELDIDEDDDDIPELVEADDIDVDDANTTDRPVKKQRTT